MIASSFLVQSCTKHITDVQHDTDTLVRHDTIPGPAFLRFISILNNSPASGIVLLKLDSAGNPDVFTDVNPQMGKQYNAIPPDSTFKFYASFFYGIGKQKVDSITIPPTLKPYSLYTIVLFSTGDPGDPILAPLFINDSAKRVNPPSDSCYVRFINGLPDYPQPNPSVNLHIDNINAPAYFKDNVNYQEVRNYSLIKAGNHVIYVRSETDISQSYSVSQNFEGGKYYTIRLTGKHADLTDALSVDSE